MPMIEDHTAEILQHSEDEYLFSIDGGSDGTTFATLLTHVLQRDRVRVHLSGDHYEPGVVRAVHIDNVSGRLQARVELTSTLYPTIA